MRKYIHNSSIKKQHARRARYHSAFDDDTDTTDSSDEDQHIINVNKALLSKENDKKKSKLLASKQKDFSSKQKEATADNKTTTHLEDANVEAQEEIIEDMSHAVERLKHIGQQMGHQITNHKSILTDLNDNLTIAKEKFIIVEKKLDKLIQKSCVNHCQIIICLSFTAAVLLFLIIYTLFCIYICYFL